MFGMAFTDAIVLAARRQNGAGRTSDARRASGVFCAETDFLPSHSSARSRRGHVGKGEEGEGCDQQPVRARSLCLVKWNLFVVSSFSFFPLPACLSSAVGKLDFQIKKAVGDEDSRFLLPFNNHPCLLFGESSLYISFLNVPSKWGECL